MAESLPPRKTCITCRTRKVRCDGQEPCGRCTKASRGSPECVYEDLRASEKDNVPVLTKGSACLPCRRKKKRCNGERPVCTTCAAVGKPGMCEFEEGQTFTLALLEKTRELEERLASVAERPLVTEFPPGLDPSAELDRALAEFQVRKAPAPTPMSQIFSDQGLVPSVLANLNDFRKVFIQHRGHFCFSMQGPRMYALLSGDNSGEFAHPAMINAAELLGFVMWQEQQGQFSLLTEEYLLHLTNESLATLEHSLIHDGFDMNKFCSAVHVYCAIALYHFLGRRLPSFRDVLKQAVDLVQLVGAEHLVTMLMATPVDPSLLDAGSYSESRNAQEECVAALAQILFLDRSAVVMLDLQQPVCPDFESILDNLRNTSVVWKTNLNLLRARSASLAHAGRRLWVAWNLENQSETARATLTKRYWVLMEDLVEHIGILKVAQLRASLANDEVQKTPLKSSLLTALCTKSSMHHLIDDPESRRLALESVRDAVAITENIKDEELDYLDPLLGVSFAHASRVVFLERRRAKEEPLQALALQDEAWTAQTVRELGRVFLHLEMKMPYVAQARTIVETCCAGDHVEKLIPGG